ncbi:MAG: alpha/beta hydrolase [Anaerolineaceae bacterium]|nr:alpha/beta hydrolase [Anaerolineaceae bacterium]
MKITDTIKATWYLTKLRALNHSKQHNKELSGGILDPQVELLIHLMQLQGDVPSRSKMTAPQARADQMMAMVFYRKFSEPVAKVPNVWNSILPGPAGDIPVRFYMPEGDGPFPIFVFYHGGGWVLGDLNLADNFARTISYYGKVSVISVDYRLAPEHKFPAGLEDCYAAYKWAALPQNASKIRGNVDQLIVGGGSAGANLAAAVALKAKQENGPKIAQQVLIYPVTNLNDMETASYQAYGEFPILTKDDMDWFIQHYINEESDKQNPFVSPALASDLSGLPPALIVAAEYDVLADDGRNYAQKLEAAGVDVKLIEAKGLPHGFVSLREMIKRAHHYSILMLQSLNKRIK